jgi:glycosyltransferase involved in cell wall biosynthesis
LRILHLANNFHNPANGTTNLCIELALSQRALGHDVAIAAPISALSPYRSSGITVLPFDPDERYILRRLGEMWKLREAIKKFDPEIIHTHIPRLALLARVLAPCRTMVATAHSDFSWQVWGMAAADVIVGVSVASEEALKRRLQVLHKRTRANTNGVIDGQRLPLLRSQDNEIYTDATQEIAQPSVVAVGAISYRKGSDLLVKAMAGVLADGVVAHLYFVGNEDWEVPRELANDLKIAEWVHFLGAMSVATGYLASATVVAITSRAEGLPLTLLEARALGKPILATAVGGMPEGLEQGVAGLVVDLDADAIRTGLVTLLRDDSLRAKLRESASANLYQYSAERMARDYVGLYHELARHRYERRQITGK